MASADLRETGAAENPGAAIDYNLFLDCVHCGLCTASCPTYIETGDENNSPRGRIYLMRAVTDQRLELTPNVERHLDLCLDCRACETACPSGVQYGNLIEPFRVAMRQLAPNGAPGRARPDWFYRWVLFGLFPYRERLRWSMLPARIAQKLGLANLAEAMGLYSLLPSRLRQVVTMLPKIPKPLPPLPEFLPAKGRRRARVGLFTGCVADVLFRPTHWATARVLQENGCDVITPRTQQCCGAIHFHAGNSPPARDMADANAAAFPNDLDAIIVNVAGCGSMLKDYGHHWDRHGAVPNTAPADGGATHEEDSQTPENLQVLRETFAGKVRDVSEFLIALGLKRPVGRLPVDVVYHDACHLAHAQGVREQPRALLKKIPGLRLHDLPESELCCGAAGTYNLTEPEMAEQLVRRKVDHIDATGARIIATANTGCTLQIAREIRRRRNSPPPAGVENHASYRSARPQLPQARH